MNTIYTRYHETRSSGGGEWPPLDLSKIDNEFKCPMCLNVLANAHQADDCGCRFCSNCLDQLILQEDQRCLQCNSVLVSKSKFPDKYFQKKVNQMLVKCIDCDWSGNLTEYKEHFYTPNNHHTTTNNLITSSRNNSSSNLIILSPGANSNHAPSALATTPIGSSNLNNEVRFQQLNNKLDIGQNIQNGLLNDIDKVMKANNKLKQECKLLREQLAECKSTTQELHKVLALTQVSLLSIEERIINQEKASYDGTLLWKLNNIHERIQEAKSGRQTSLYSPPFYTSRNGYKMCSRIYLNGDGNGRNTHLSLFFVILRGENDALLRWPFKQKVTFILIDQSNSESKENIYDAFRPDPNSSSFRRPVSDMNIASGLPLFCPLGKLMSSDHEYIKDNTLFIKIIVDVKDLAEI